MRTDLTPDERAEGEAVTAFLAGLVMPQWDVLRQDGHAKVFVRGADVELGQVVMHLATARGFQIDVTVRLVGIED